MRNSQVAAIPLGIDGITSDDPQTLILPFNLRNAKNVSLRGNKLEKDPGSKRLNRTAFDGGVKAVYDFWPKPHLQRLVAVTSTGKTWRMRNQGDITLIAQSGDAPETLSVAAPIFVLECGAESAGRDKKLMIMNGQNPVQVISGDSLLRANIAAPAADWSTSNQPTFGFIHRNCPVLFGNRNDPHRIYIGNSEDHEDFLDLTNAVTLSVYPAVAEKLVYGFVYKSRAFLVKYPFAVFYIDDSGGAHPSNWVVREYTRGFGGAGPFAGMEAVDDFIMLNATGSLTSFAATQAFGDVKQADILTQLKVEQFFKERVSTTGIQDHRALYYGDKQTALFAVRGRGRNKNTGIIEIDYSSQKPKITWHDKDQANCLALRKNFRGIQKPIYGSEDGYVYEMDQVMRNVGDEAYRSEFTTGDYDFSQLGPEVAEKMKRFMALELVYEPTGLWDVHVEVWIDGVYRETVPFKVGYGKTLGGRQALTTVTTTTTEAPAAPVNMGIATEPWRPIPQPHEPWDPSFVGVFSYCMAPNEIRYLPFRIRSSAAATLALGGAGAGDFTASFHKPFGQVVDRLGAFTRPSIAASPNGTYFDPLNPIPAGANNFTPEVADTWEWVFLKIKATGTPGTKLVEIQFNGETIYGQIKIWNNITLPTVPSRQLSVLAGGTYAGNGTQFNYTNDTNQATAVKNLEDLLIEHRLTPYGSPTSFLAISGAVLNVDQNSASGGSFRQTIMNKLAATHHKFWFCIPMFSATHRSAAYAAAAEATIVAESLTDMWVYIADEPTQGQAATLKAALDAWSVNSPSTKILLTTTKDYQNGAGAVAAGLNFASYANLVLVPVIQQIGQSGFPAISAYSDNLAGFYTSCQGNCQARTNSNSSNGTDQGEVDLAYIDLPMIRRRASFMLAQRTGWREKIATMLYYNSAEAWSDLNPGGLTLSTQNSWLSARRFGVMGDGTLAYPSTQGYQPHVGLAAFSGASLACVGSIRLAELAHASFMADLIELYRLAHGTNLADNLVTDSDTFETDYEAYELLRQQVGDALEAGGVVDTSTTQIGTGYSLTTTSTDTEEVISAPEPGGFRLDHDRLMGRTPRSRGQKIHGRGKRIGFKVYQQELNQNFKLLQLRVHFKVLGEKELEDDQ